MSGFAEHLREARIKAGLNQPELAEKVAVDKSYISKLERGVESPPSRKVAVKLADALGISDQEERIRFFSAAGVVNDEDLQRFALVKVGTGQGKAQGPQAVSPPISNIAQTQQAPAASAAESSVLRQILEQLGRLTAAVSQLQAEVSEVKETVTELNSALQEIDRSSLPHQVPEELSDEWSRQELEAALAERDQPQDTVPVASAAHLRRVTGRWAGFAGQTLPEGTHITCMFSSEALEEVITVPRAMTILIPMRLTLEGIGDTPDFSGATADFSGAGELDLALDTLGVKKAKTVSVNIKGVFKSYLRSGLYFGMRLQNSEETSVRLYMKGWLGADGRTLSGTYHVEQLFTKQTLEGRFSLKKVEGSLSSEDVLRMMEIDA